MHAPQLLGRRVMPDESRKGEEIGNRAVLTQARDQVAQIFLVVSRRERVELLRFLGRQGRLIHRPRPLDSPREEIGDPQQVQVLHRPAQCRSRAIEPFVLIAQAEGVVLPHVVPAEIDDGDVRIELVQEFVVPVESLTRGIAGNGGG